MAENPIEYSRLIMKRSSIPTTIPTVNTGDTIDNTWTETDILSGELFFNLNDHTLYTRSGDDIILLSSGTTGTTGTTVSQTLEQTLVAGNTTGSNSINVADGEGLLNTSVIGGLTINQRILFNQNPGVLRLWNENETDGEETFINIIPTGVSVQSLDGGIGFNSQSLTITGNNNFPGAVLYNRLFNWLHKQKFSR